VPAPMPIPLYLVPSGLSGSPPVPSRNPSLSASPSLRARNSLGGIFDEISRLFNELNDIRFNSATFSASSLGRTFPPT
jgi:hypothetical protein